MKDALKRLSKVGLEINHALDDGVSLFGLNLSHARRSYAGRSDAALARSRQLKPRSVLDVGSGGGHHAKAFAQDGAVVTCIDFGTSIYAKEAADMSSVQQIQADFASWVPDRKYDLVWASHVLEHQRNVGIFLEKLVACCDPTGHIAIVVPTPHRRLWGGHLTLWTPGLLAYNIVLCGIDLSEASLDYGYRESWIIFQPKRVALPDLTFDSGDLDKLAAYLPQGLHENGDAWI